MAGVAAFMAGVAVSMVVEAFTEAAFVPPVVFAVAAFVQRDAVTAHAVSDLLPLAAT